MRAPYAPLPSFCPQGFGVLQVEKHFLDRLRVARYILLEKQHGPFFNIVEDTYFS